MRPGEDVLTGEVMSTITQPITVEEYERMVEDGTLAEDSRVELIEGRLVEKMAKSNEHRTATQRAHRAIGRLLPAGWHVCKEDPVRIPGRNSEPEPDLSVVRGDIDDHADQPPGPGDIALIVEVARSSMADDRGLAVTYGSAGIPVYWIVNVDDRQLEVYCQPTGGAYPAPAVLNETDKVDLVIDGQVIGQIAVADLLPKRQ